VRSSPMTSSLIQSVPSASRARRAVSTASLAGEPRFRKNLSSDDEKLRNLSAASGVGILRQLAHERPRPSAATHGGGCH
jgi:hypothetical protein